MIDVFFANARPLCRRQLNNTPAPMNNITQPIDIPIVAELDELEEIELSSLVSSLVPVCGEPLFALCPIIST
jgi:hypothetical protein